MINDQWLESELELLRNSLRRGQQGLAHWNGGEMAVSAVPGAGKSHSLSVAAAIAIARNQLHSRRQLIVVTYTRSAAANIKLKIRDRLKDLKLPPGGFVVHTLHGLALNIANSRQELAGLNLDNVSIVVPNAEHRIIRTAVEQWIGDHPVEYQTLLEGIQFDGEETERLRRQSVLRTEVLPQLTNTVVREAKSSGLLPDELAQLSQSARDEYGILNIAAGLYQEYQRLMRSQDLIDYDDMILAALKVLEYPPMRLLWQNQVYGVFEDEAQDSSPLQEKLISILAGSDEVNSSPNLVRVGDPNQAINSTFTPADPIYFKWFCQNCQTKNSLTTMNQAGRSSEIIIDAANFVVSWVNQQQGDRNPEQLPFREQKIVTVDRGDPQPDANPQPEGSGVMITNPDDVYQTVKLIGEKAIALFKEHPDHNAAILVRENRQGRFLAQELAYLNKEHDIKVYEISESERYSQIPGEILKLLQFIDRPHSPDNLKAALEVLQQRSLIPTQDLNALATSPEQFLYPTVLTPPHKPQVEEARRYCCNLLRARMELPHYQIIPFLGMTLKYTGSELATVQKLSERVNQQIIGQSSLKASINALEEIVTAENFEGVEEDNEDRYTRPGQITIITMHKAKGLDWDYVFIPFLHQDILPGQPWIPKASQFLGNFTLSEVARAQIRAIVHHQYILGDRPQVIPLPNAAWEEAVKLKQAEEYRLLYVAMTRAKRLLWMSAAQLGPFRWSVFRQDSASNLQQKKPCPVLPALIGYLRNEY
ncbi:ATP-dependent helicase [Waterburya agarophytonicola K14]|uniref:DNA 3'-5' helicase n=1 Tax=Waterburya agarophytonicola KI4 TaxID=2874699 RepID=A0A964FI78_9CYAN|nr:ATP-dependent helicase [Waterburya agarophytonicola]MCC0178229.1 ATP-dependent helicase [Waterburya agarophytonicola KI4]